MTRARRWTLVPLTVLCAALLALVTPSFAAKKHPPVADAGAEAGAPAEPATPAAPGRPPNAPLRIYTKPIEPFAYQSEGKAVGFSIDLWDRVAKDAGLTYELHWVQSVNDLIEALKKDEADGAVAAI